ncbi:MAG TPA: cupin domain-containing protein [Hyphomicrobiaceae bacterium]|jgi:quercetin dioxygenase-like cupin family protein|nr:cupin domain-containing protein [Hyphomicrobiaceae bacterium]
MQKKSIATAFLLLLAFGCSQGAVTALADDAHHTVVAGDAVKWGPAPPSLPSGAEAAVLLGNPGKEGPFVLRLKFPDGFTVPPHRHSKDEFVTVISGKFAVGAGEKVDRTTARPLPAASFVHMPAGMAHYAWADGEAVVQINGFGPFDVKYVDPKDDPRNK